MKKILISLLVGIGLIGLVECGNSNNSVNNIEDDTKVIKEAKEGEELPGDTNGDGKITQSNTQGEEEPEGYDPVNNNEPWDLNHDGKVTDEQEQAVKDTLITE